MISLSFLNFVDDIVPQGLSGDRGGRGLSWILGDDLETLQRFPFSPSSFFPPRSGRANVQSDTFNILEEIDGGVRSVLHYFPLFSSCLVSFLWWSPAEAPYCLAPPSHRLPQKKTTKDTSELKL